MIDNNIQLDVKLVGKIKGEFYVPSYQRGYRWDQSQVIALLDDVYNNKEKPYCLQPIVVRKDVQGRYELIDGQQRLTTLFIIYKFMIDRWPDYIENINYSLTYETREGNMDFFNHIENEELANANIDFFFMHRAYMTVKDWFARERNIKPLHVAGDITKYFDNNVKVIWYELQSGTREDATKLFTRLNIGRIPLTNAELVKALFLCESEEITRDKQMEISLQWDTIERELHDSDFWYFLTKKKEESYATRIELLFNFIAGKKDDEREQFYTFYWFNERKADTGIKQLWNEILSYYYRLKEWYKNDKLYHKIGYLVASGTSTIDKMMTESKDLKKSQMDNLLDEWIRKSVDCKKPYAELNYINDYGQITNILLLFNVISLMKNGSGARFPFKEFNNEEWSLEHIHAQHSLKLNTQEKWKEWLLIHLDSVKGMDNTAELVQEMQNALSNERLTDVEFNNLSDRIMTMFSEQGDTEYVHSLSNMALLQCSKNSALSNALFDAKCRKIREMDAQGQFIPYCTRMVFMKYYSSEKQDSISLHFWGKKDREAYIEKMNEILNNYLKEPIGDGSK